MSPLFWLDITFLSISTIIAATLALIALGSGIKFGLNRAFALFILIEASWAILSMLLRLSLWLDRGNPQLLSELTSLAFALIGPSLLLFTAYYLPQRFRYTVPAVVLGVGAIALLAIPLFQHNLVSNPQLDANGGTTLYLSSWGIIAATIPLISAFWSLVLFWRARRQLSEPYLAAGIAILLAGLVLGGILNVSIPILSITNTVSIVILGYGVISQQLFNPLKEQTRALQREIEERARIEKALRSSEERFRLFVERARDALYVHDNQGRILDVNAEACATLGYSKEELLQLTVTDIDANYTLDEVKRIWETMDEGTSTIMETTHRRKDGTTLPVEVNVTQFSLDNKTAFLVLGRDITGRKRDQDQLRKLWRAIKQSHNTVVITDTQGRMEYTNPKFSQLTGYTPEEALGQTSKLLNSGKHPPEFYEALWLTIQSGKVWQGEFQNRKKNGELYWEFASISPVRDSKGNITNFVKVAEDITGRKQSADALIKASRMETAATLAGGIAHKVNNLMTAVLGYAELLKSKLNDNPDAVHILATISKSARQTGDLAQQMLDFARGGKYQPRLLNLNDIIEEIIQLQQRNMPAQVTIKQNVPPDLWTIEGDPTQMSQVILNLLTNAIEAIEQEGRVTISTANIDPAKTSNAKHPRLEQGRYICLTVEDTGCGMDEDTLARVFEPFFTTKFQGRGMGLAAVYGIVDNHNGQITINSQPGRGTTCQVYLPAAGTEQPSAPAAPASQESTPPDIDREKRTILIAEDDPVIVEIVSRMVKMMGHRPLVANNGKEAINIARSFDEEIHLTLLDLGLPVLNGADAFPHLIKARPQMAVILFSGYKIDDTAQAILDAGAKAFIQKPFQLETLKSAIGKALG